LRTDKQPAATEELMQYRIFSSLENSFIAAYYVALYLTPANVRGLWQTVAQLKTQIVRRRARGKATPNHSLAWASLLLLCCASASFGQSSNPVAVKPISASTASTTSPAALLPAARELREQGTAALFNIDYATARAKFEEIRQLMPQHPAGDLYLGISIWLEHLYRNRRLQTSLYNSESSFYAGAENAKEETEGDQVDPAVDKAFRDRIQQAKLKALTLFNQNKKDPDALYFLGAVHGVLAGYEASTARKFFAAMRNGSRNVDLHQKVIELKPDYYDAYLSIGTYHYILGSLPFYMKALAALGGMRGNKQKGISELQTVVEKGTNADDASVLLLAIYQNEKRPNDALAVLQRLSAKYPRNYLLKLEATTTLVELNRYDEAYQQFESLLRDESAAPVADLVRYKYAEALAAQKQFTRAAEQFLAVPQLKTAQADLTTISLLRAAQIYDLAGKRALALVQYQAVLARPNVYDSHEQAERGLKHVYVEKEKEKKSE
jgi:tetratricopeptide (TPR) repeat protein